MNYPNHLVELEDGLSLYLPDVMHIKATYERLSEMDADTPFPFWATIWPCSNAIIRYLKLNPKWIQGKDVLELGAGIGQPSFAISNKAKSVIVSDYSIDAVELMGKNIAHLGIQNAKAMVLDWNEMDYTITADTILLSDLNYDAEAFEPLTRMIEHYIAKGATIIIGTPGRIMGGTFIEQIRHYVKHSHKESIVEYDSIIPIHIYVLEQ